MLTNAGSRWRWSLFLACRKGGKRAEVIRLVFLASALSLQRRWPVSRGRNRV